ncbi:formate dehydrogenase accessory protein FdhE [Uliginosibacterium sediminicola]|uniref:Formate dehydrogenase accessory protein FdhE n=1 Tax=Uliginosibacterium sediminicola TaxID=2024550 RepID=A0ABU9YVR4_9RHOO
MLPPQSLPTAVSPTLLLAPAVDVFARRAARFRSLAAQHSQGLWLNWLAALSEAQQSLAATPAILAVSTQTDLLAAAPAAVEQLRQLFNANAYGMDGFAVALDESLVLDQARSVVQMAAGSQLLAAAERSHFLIVAAMQVLWAQAARLRVQQPQPAQSEAHEACPCCGSAALGSIIMAGEGKAGLRYLECSLCATRWNAVRARCTLCTQGEVVQYLALEGAHAAVQAETCDCCQGYIKTFMQTKDIAVEPAADDLASLALDVLVGEQGFARGAPNLFLCEAEAA